MSRGSLTAILSGMALAARRLMDATAALLQQLLLCGVLPLWLLAGFGDWLCHRVQHIETSAGLGESMLHWLMLAELGVGIAAALLLDVTAAVLVLLVVACIAHELTLWRDLFFAAARRRIAVPEQWVHGLQLALPWVGLAALLVIHRDQALAAVGLGSAAADWDWRWKNPPLPAGTLAAIAAGAVAFVLLPFAEEWRRCRLARA
jgi:hypothetical protein